ncbi:MAG: ATP-binding protein, partial [Chitinophagales bacterium]
NLQSHLDTYFEIKSYEIVVFRFWTLLVAFFLPVYGVFLLAFSPDAIDFISHRVYISASWFFLFLSSFWKVFFKKYLALFVYLLNFITISWITWIVHINQFSTDYSIGLLLSITCIGMIFRNLWEVSFYFFFCLFIILLSFYHLNTTDIDKYVYCLSLTVVYSTQGILMWMKDYINRNLSKLNAELYDKNNQLEQFVYVASHDLKSPLRTIGSFTSLLERRLEHHESEAIHDYVNYILSGVKQMNVLIDDLLKYATHGVNNLHFEANNLQLILQEMKDKLLKGKQEEAISIDLPENLPIKIVGNPTQFSQLFQNLLENSIKYNRSTNKRITISYEESKHKHHFCIEDNGIGIESSYTNQVFQLFKRLHTKQEFEGTGIGLALCKRIVENHKGSIIIQSEGLGKGARACFSLSKKLKPTKS